MDRNFKIPQMTYSQTYATCPSSFYARDEMKRIIHENCQLKDAIHKITGRRWGEDIGPGKYTSDGKLFMPLDVTEQRNKQLTICMNVMINVVAEYLTHLKKCAMPYMEAFARNDIKEIKKHHEAFMPSHLKSIITFQKYVQSVIVDAERDCNDFNTMVQDFSQDDKIHEDLNETYNMHYNIIAELNGNDVSPSMGATPAEKVYFRNIAISPEHYDNVLTPDSLD